MRAKEIVTAAITLPAAAYATPEQRRAFYGRLEQRLRTIPEAVASITSALPLTGAPQVPLDIPGHPASPEMAKTTVRTVAIRPGYFDALGLSLLLGRDFDDDDGMPGQAYAIVNERFVQRYMSGQDPLGQQLRLISAHATERPPLKIVGVAPDIRQRPFPQPQPVV